MTRKLQAGAAALAILISSGTIWYFFADRIAPMSAINVLASEIDAEEAARVTGDYVNGLKAEDAILGSRIEQKTMALEDIIVREQEGRPLSVDLTRRVKLERDIDRLISRQEKLITEQRKLTGATQ